MVLLAVWLGPPCATAGCLGPWKLRAAILAFTAQLFQGKMAAVVVGPCVPIRKKNEI
jgi:hypothetical protein